TGWRHLTWAWIGFFLALAAANEIVWRHFTTDQWVTFKAFGIPIAAVVFSVALSPILRRHAVPAEE
ncbi:MAG: septation protein IspZ, partial [Pseudomonadota bacterium]|nr:septation protein IspZ [Pseudomonadota bacterium]